MSTIPEFFHQNAALVALLERTGLMGVCAIDPQAKSFWCSGHFREMFGLREGGELAQLTQMIDPEDAHLLRESVSLLENGKTVTPCLYRMHTGGKIKWVRQYGYLADKETGGAFAVWKDVTEEQLQRNKVLFFEKLVDASIDGIMVLDKELHVILWNSRNELVNGIPRTEVIGKKWMDIEPDLEKSPEIAEALQHALMGLASFVPATKNAGAKGYFEQHFLPLKNESGEVIGILNIRHDVAHRVKAEDELRDLNRSLLGSNRALSQRNAELQVFSHITSHDFKEPLRKIYTAVEMIVTQEAQHINERGRQYFKQIQGAVQRIGLLADDILSYARLDVQTTAFTEVDLGEVIAIVSRRLEEQIRTTNAIITTNDLPVYTGHKLMLVQLFQNLMGNALKFQEQNNQPRISIEADSVAGLGLERPEADPGAVYTRIRFTDNGIGFKRKYNDRIFEVFMRINKTLYPGSGTGLSLVKKIVELHDGFISVESEPGKGSTFTCYLCNKL
jgi:PAS domain S-box-containing protein